MPTLSVLERTLRGDLSWQDESGWAGDSVVEQAIEHGVDTLIWDALASAGGGPAQEIRRRLEKRVRAAATRDLLVQRELRRALEALGTAGVRVLVIKGSALAYTVYRQPWHRPRVDSDLLVSHGQLDLAARTLESCGYRRTDALSTGLVVSHQIAFEHVDSHGLHHVIDLHWKIVNPHIVADALVFEELWERRQAAPALGSFAAIPAAVHNVVLAAVHRLAHHQGDNRLIWLYDVRLLASTFSSTAWNELAVLAESRSVAGLCLDALRQAHARLDAALPEFVDRALEQAAPTEASHRYLEGRVGKIDVLESDLKTLPSWRARVRLLKEHAFPPAAFIRQRYGVKSPFLLPALYLHRLVVGAAKWVRP